MNTNGNLRPSNFVDMLIVNYNDVIMNMMASQITSFTIVYSTIYSGKDQKEYQSPAPLAFVRGIHRWLVNSSHKRQVTRKMSPFDDVIMFASLYDLLCLCCYRHHTSHDGYVHSTEMEPARQPSPIRLRVPLESTFNDNASNLTH